MRQHPPVSLMSAQSPVPFEKAQQDLLSKHVLSRSTGDVEIQLYRCVSIVSVLIMFWLGGTHKKISIPDCHSRHVDLG